MQGQLKQKTARRSGTPLFDMGGEYRSRTDDLLHAMQAL